MHPSLRLLFVYLLRTFYTLNDGNIKDILIQIHFNILIGIK